MKTRIYVSAKIKKVYKRLELNPHPPKEEMEQHENSWNANYLTIDSKKCWVITHNKTRYTVLLPDVSAAKVKNLRMLFLDQMINQYLKDDKNINFVRDVDPNQFNNFIGEFEFYPTNNDKSCIAYINKRIEDLEYHKYYAEDQGDIPFYRLGALINQFGSMRRNGKSVRISPVKEMLELIKGRL